MDWTWYGRLWPFISAILKFCLSCERNIWLGAVHNGLGKQLARLNLETYLLGVQ